jgi:Pyridoxamine 5'-phosphate oxidase
LAPARSYWLATVDAGGAPHTVPVWGAVESGILYLYMERRSAKARHVAANQAVAVHLPDPEDVLVVEGELRDLGHPGQNLEVVAAFDAKYCEPADAVYLPSHDPAFDVVYELKPRRAMTWQLADFDGSQARWTLGDRDPGERLTSGRPKPLPGRNQ